MELEELRKFVLWSGLEGTGWASRFFGDCGPLMRRSSPSSFFWSGFLWFFCCWIFGWRFEMCLRFGVHNGWLEGLGFINLFVWLRSCTTKSKGWGLLWGFPMVTFQVSYSCSLLSIRALNLLALFPKGGVKVFLAGTYHFGLANFFPLLNFTPLTVFFLMHISGFFSGELVLFVRWLIFF